MELETSRQVKLLSKSVDTRVYPRAFVVILEANESNDKIVALTGFSGHPGVAGLIDENQH
jgi:hypothetical protein